MANPTTNYSFVLPTSASLVTNLPADFDVALQGVDTRLKALQPGTTLGDLVYSSATANTSTRLGIGTNGQVLSISGGVPAWATTADQTPLTTKGDLFTFTTLDARLGVGANNTVLTADSAQATGLKWATPASSGKVLQVVQGTQSSIVTTTSTSYVTTGLSASITPSLASSKVLAFYVLTLGVDIANFFIAHTLFRGTVAGTNLATNSFGIIQGGAYLRINAVGNFLDSPATTAATTYTVGFKAESTATGTVNPGPGSTAVLILMEIAA